MAEKFYTVIKQEGSNGAIRGKVSAGMAAAMGAGDESVIEWNVRGKVATGQVIKGAEARKILNGSASNRVSSTKAPAKKAKAVAKSSNVVSSKGTGKKLKKAVAKPSKRRTEVEYDEAPRKLKLGKKKLKLKRNR